MTAPTDMTDNTVLHLTLDGGRSCCRCGARESLNPPYRRWTNNIEHWTRSIGLQCCRSDGAEPENHPEPDASLRQRLTYILGEEPTYERGEALEALAAKYGLKRRKQGWR